MDSIESCCVDGKTTLKLENPSANCWLVAHDTSGMTCVIKVSPGQVCETGLSNLEMRATKRAAESLAAAYGWVDPTPMEQQFEQEWLSVQVREKP